MSRRAPRQVRLEVQTLTPDGLGLGVAEARPVSVKNALPGELVSAKVLKRRRGVWHAEAATPERTSPLRVEPPCGNFPRCGGCAMMHIDYPRQLESKEGQLRAALAAVGVTPQRWLPPRSGPRLGYRTKARLGVRVVGGAVLAGFRETLSNRVARMDSCCTLIPAFSALLAPLKKAIAELSAPDKIPQVELAAGDAGGAVIVRHLEMLNAADRRVLLEFAERSGVRLFLQSGGYDTVEELTAAESPYLGYANHDYGLYFEFMPWDFTQVNLRMNRQLVRAAMLGLDAPSGSRVFDLFCGIGNFSLAAAATGARVVGYEGAPDSVARARHNAARNGLAARCEFGVADLYDPGCTLAGGADYVLLDPPRSGAGENLRRWMRTLAPQRIAYVSCEPGSFARDARVLKEAGFELTSAGIFDMFPHTAHVETLGLFRRSW